MRSQKQDTCQKGIKWAQYKTNLKKVGIGTKTSELSSGNSND